MFRYAYLGWDVHGQDHFFGWVGARADEDFSDAIQWCEDRHGPRNLDGAWYYTTVDKDIWFREECDAFEFKMRWC